MLFVQLERLQTLLGILAVASAPGGHGLRFAWVNPFGVLFACSWPLEACWIYCCQVLSGGVFHTRLLEDITPFSQQISEMCE